MAALPGGSVMVRQPQRLGLAVWVRWRAGVLENHGLRVQTHILWAQTVVGAACCHGSALRITEASFSILNIWIWTINIFREALIMNINMSHVMFLNIFDFSEILMCKRWKLTLQFLPHPAVMEVLEQLMQPKQLFSEWLVCTNTMRTKWTQPCVSAWEWSSRRTLGGGELPKQQPNKRNPCYFNSTFLSSHFIFLIVWSYIQIQCLILFNPFIIQTMIKN